MNESTLIIGNIIGYVLQSIFLAYFIISVKNIKEKRILFIFCVFAEYLFLRTIRALDYNVNFEVLLGIMIYLMLKIIYKNKARITDFITYIISLVFLGIISIPVALTIGMNIYGLVIADSVPIIITYLLRHKLTYIDKFYNKFWNKHNNKKMLKSVTIRGISTVLTIITFLLLHIWLIYGIYLIRR